MAGHAHAISSEAPKTSPRCAVDAAPQADVRVAHAIEDVLLCALTVALSLDDRISPPTASNVVKLFLQAQREGRANELVVAARRQAHQLPDWECKSCLESNPGTFEICWNCRLPQQPDAPRLDAMSEVVLAIELATTSRCDDKSAPEMQ